MTPHNNKNETTILTTNIHIFYFMFFLLNKTKLLSISNNYQKNDENVKLSFFMLPKKKKTTIFLRAPYKNKLARLNILQVSNHIIISLIVKHSSTKLSLYKNSSLLDRLGNIDFSSNKIKHTKTKIIHQYTRFDNFKKIMF